jgi:hypothetical protein
VASIVALALFGVSCSDATTTQLVVLMDTDYSVPAEVDRVRARVAKVIDTDADEQEVETWLRIFPVSDNEARDIGAYELPATFAVLPADADLEREITVELQALASGSDQILVTRRVRTGFVRGEARLVRMLIYRACAELTCADGETCGCAGGTSCAAPSCVDERLPPELLESIADPGLLPPNSEFPTGTDGGVSDGGIPPDDAGTEPDGAVDPDGGSECDAPLVSCDSECVNTLSDPRYCGGCSIVCPGGYVCERGLCVDPGDCRTNDIGCTGFTYCNEATGDCLRGCAGDPQCIKDHEICDTNAHACVCSPGFERCAFDCVDTQTDPRFCGGCLTSCPSGEVCEAGNCLDLGDCRTNGIGCSGFTYCDEATGGCLRGCESNVQCTGENQVCNSVLHECECGPGFHPCGGACVSDLDVATCGTACTPCPTPNDSTPTCDVGVCDFVCHDPFERCGDACCPTSCPAGQVLLEGACDRIHVRTADDQGNVGEYSAVSLDETGTPHAAYYSASGRNLLHGNRQTSGLWLRETADAPGEVGQHASLAFDPGGQPNIAYYESSNKDLLFVARQSGGTWTRQTIDAEIDVGEYASLAFDPSGLAHISYYDRTDKDLLLARRSNGTWSIETVASQGDVGQYTSLAFDPSGLAFISYYDQKNKDLLVATRGSGTWSIEAVASQGDVGQYTSLAFDPSGLALVSYYDETNKDLMIAKQQSDGQWNLHTVDTQGDVGTYTSLAVDASGVGHISYFDRTNLDLKHAVQKPGDAWKIETVDSQGDVGRFSSIAVDDEGHAHITYYDATNTNLKYALVAAQD